MYTNTILDAYSVHFFVLILYKTVIKFIIQGT